MGLNVGLNALTTGGLFIATIFIVIMGILLISAERNIQEIPEYSQSSELQNGRSKLQTAYVLTFIAAGITLVLAIVYSGHDIWWCPPEWIHMVFFLIVIVLMVIAAIYAYVILENIYDPRLETRTGVDSFIWAALWFAVLGFLTLFVVGSGRAGYTAVREKMGDRLTDLEHKVHQSYACLTGEPVNYEKIGADPEVAGQAAPSNKAPHPPVAMARRPNQKAGCGPPPYERHRPPQPMVGPPRSLSGAQCAHSPNQAGGFF